MDKGSLIKLAREGKTMSCTCSLKPANLKIIRIGESEVGFIGLEKSFRQVYFLKVEDEAKLREKLMEKIKENNFIPPKEKSLTVKRCFASTIHMWKDASVPKRSCRNPGNKIPAAFLNF